MNKDLKFFLKNIESRANYLYKHNYKKYIHINYNDLIIESLMCNGKCHLVAIFKNYLIEDDLSEYMHRFYNSKESPHRLKKLFLYHEETSIIFPNYIPLIESKYLYNNVIKKQRIIDEQQNNENKQNGIKLSKKKKAEVINNDEKVFDSEVFGEILNQSESVLRIVFGIEKKRKKINDYIFIEDNSNNLDKNEINLKNNYINENSNSNDESEYEGINKLIKELDTIEEAININNLFEDKLNNNNNNHNLKYKVKLINSPKINQTKKNNNEKYNNITSSSTNITNISNNNINSKINLNKINNNQNKLIKEFILKSSKYEILKNNLTITHSVKKSKEKIQSLSNNNTTIQTHKKSKSNMPNRSLFGLNLKSTNNIINLLVNQDKNSRRFNSNLNSCNTSKINTYNNYIKNHKFPMNTKVISKNINFINTINYNSTIKTSNIIDRIPKIDIIKIDMINNKNNNKVLTLTNRNTKRNNNYILNNPNLFFGITEILKSERNIISKRSQKKSMKKKILNNQFISFSPNHKGKDFFGRKINKKLILISEPNAKTMTEKRNKKYISNKIIDKNERRLLINEYNFKEN